MSDHADHLQRAAEAAQREQREDVERDKEQGAEIERLGQVVRELSKRVWDLEQAVPESPPAPSEDETKLEWPELPGAPEDYDEEAVAAWKILGPRWIDVITAPQRGSSGPIESPLRSTSNKPLRQFVDSLAPGQQVTREVLIREMREGMAEDLADQWHTVHLRTEPTGDGGDHVFLKSTDRFCSLVIRTGRSLGLWDEIEVNP